MRVVITGANRGIGLELARQYLARGDSVHAGVRDPGSAGALRALGGEVQLIACDVASDASVRAFAAAVSGPVDVLINNAGVRNKEHDDLGDFDAAAAERTMQVNALGAVRVTGALLPRLRAARSAKIANITSGLGSITDNTSGGGYAYRMSKAALNMATRSMAADLKADGIVCVALSPGWARTDMGGPNAPVPVAESAAGLIALIDRLTLEQTGSFFGHLGERIAW